MRKLCPNLDREDFLDTVLEVPVPEEMFISGGNSRGTKLGCTNMKAWMRPHSDRSPPSPIGHTGPELQLMLSVIGAPLVPLPVNSYQSKLAKNNIKNDPIDVSMAKYIVQQYIAATGGEQALNSIKSMYAMGKVRMMASEIPRGGNGNKMEGNVLVLSSKKGKKNTANNIGEMGGFVLWQKKPDLWCLELMVSGYKMTAGSDGKVSWRQTPWQSSHPSRGPPRPLRRFLQGLDPRSTTNLFANSVCLGERKVKGEDCFVLRIDAEPSTLRSRSNSNVEIIRHTVWGCFSQRSGLLVQLEDSHLLRIKSAAEEGVYWETTMESSIEDYRTVDGVNIAHGGRTNTTLFRFGESSDRHVKTRMEEVWTIEEVDFNIWGLSMDCFLPPSELKDDRDSVSEASPVTVSNVTPLKCGLGGGGRVFPPLRVQQSITVPPKISPAVGRIGPAQVAALDIEEEGEEKKKHF